jgi:peptide/nickel transport system substrate-binding protein
MSRSTTIKGLALVAALSLGAAACTSSSSPAAKSSSSGSSASNTALVIESNTGSTAYVDNFNPFDSSGFVDTENTAALVYEPLFQINTLDSSAPPIPWLATGDTWSNNNETLTLALRQGVKWSDGTPFTSADVAFTFKLVTTDQAANISGVPTPTSISTPDANTVVLTYAAPQAANFVAIADQLIVQKAQWSSVTTPDTYVLPGASAIGTGPYVLDSFNPQDVRYKVNPSYWGGAPKVKEVSVPLYSSNDAATLALSDGQIDLAGNDINNVLSTFVAKNPTSNHLFQASAPYFPAGNTVALLLNNKDSKSPFLADTAVRKAISAALNRQSMATQCEESYEAPATSAGGLTLPTDQSALDPATANDLSPTPVQSTVVSLMQGDGFTLTNGKWTKGGKTVDFTIIDPNSFTDYWCDAKSAATELNTAGFNVTPNGAFTYATWNQAITTGNFDAALHWGSGSTPFQRLQTVLDYTQSAPEGSAAAADFDRYQSSTATAAVAAYEGASSPAAEQTALDSLQEVIANDVPAIPVLYGADWYEYTSANFTGFPTQANPYIGPGPENQSYEYLILHLTPVA